jgi:hypothetical protein
MSDVSTDSSGDVVASLVNMHFAKSLPHTSLKMAIVTFAEILKQSSCLYTA